MALDDPGHHVWVVRMGHLCGMAWLVRIGAFFCGVRCGALRVGPGVACRLAVHRLLPGAAMAGADRGQGPGEGDEAAAQQAAGLLDAAMDGAQRLGWGLFRSFRGTAQSAARKVVDLGSESELEEKPVPGPLRYIHW